MAAGNVPAAGTRRRNSDEYDISKKRAAWTARFLSTSYDIKRSAGIAMPRTAGPGLLRTAINKKNTITDCKNDKRRKLNDAEMHEKLFRFCS